jgi:hypothetical protein
LRPGADAEHANGAEGPRRRLDRAHRARVGHAVVGIDFDNTLVCYDDVLRRLATERALSTLPTGWSKRSIRDRLRAAGREEAWTELQALAYGTRINEATPFPGAQDFIDRCGRAGVDIYVISHKTERPYAGGDVNLRVAARDWLATNGFFGGGGLAPERVYFEATREQKIARIEQVGCTHFIDDLVEFLAEPGLRPDLVRILFEPRDASEPLVPSRDPAEHEPWLRAQSWDDVATLVFGAEA